MLTQTGFLSINSICRIIFCCRSTYLLWVILQYISSGYIQPLPIPCSWQNHLQSWPSKASLNTTKCLQGRKAPLVGNHHTVERVRVTSMEISYTGGDPAVLMKGCKLMWTECVSRLYGTAGVNGGHQTSQDLPAPSRSCIYIIKPTQHGSFSAQGEKNKCTKPNHGMFCISS